MLAIPCKQKANGWRDQSLTSFFHDQTGCSILRKDRNKILLRACDGRTADLFIKIFLYPNLHSRVQVCRLLGGGQELNICRRLRSIGVTTPDPVGYAIESTWFGWPRHSLYAAKWVNDARTLQDLIIHNEWEGKDRIDRLGDLTIALGRFIATLHDKGVVSKDLTAGNLMVRQLAGGRFEFLLVDYERIRFLRRVPRSKCLKSLSQVGAFLLPFFADAAKSLSRGYVEIRKDLDLHELSAQVDEYSQDKMKMWLSKTDDRFSKIGAALERSRSKINYQSTFPEFRFVCDVLEHFITRRRGEIEITDQVDWLSVSRLTTAHNLGAIFNYALRSEKVPLEILSEWKRFEMNLLFKNIRSLKAAVKLFSILGNGGIRAVGMRGLTLAHRIYRSPGLRPMRDIDILISSKERDKLLAVMESCGFKPIKRLRSQYVYDIDGIEFEIHWSLLTAKRYRSKVDSDVLIDSSKVFRTPEGNIYCLSNEYELLGLVTHAFIHHDLTVMSQLVDIGLFMVRPDIDWKEIAVWCKQARMTRMFVFTLSFINYLFNLRKEKVLEQFGHFSPRERNRMFEAYIISFFERNSLTQFLRRKRNLIYIAEEPFVKIAQVFRLLSLTEARDTFQRYFKRKKIST